MSLSSIRSMRALFYQLGRLNWGVVILVGALSGAGLMMLYSAAGGHMAPWAQAQLVRFLPGFMAMLVLAFVPIRLVWQGAYPFYFLCLLLLVFVDVAGHMGMGAQRWISLGPLNLQPSELMKLAVILALARYFHTVHPDEKPGILTLAVPVLLMAAPAVLILRQPNLGTTAILVMTGVIVCFAAGVRRIYFIVVGIGGMIAAPIGWQFLHDYQKQRVLTFLDPSADPLGSGYNIIQSMIAIGSGGLSGKGFLNGSQGQLDFLPEKQTDFIFTMLAEEFGFLGCMIVLACYVLLLTYALGIALRSNNRFGALTAIGIAAVLFLHLFINVGMTMGLLPVVGVPLPLMSYGGTMLLTTLLGFGLLLNVWAHRDDKLNVRRRW